MNRALAILLIYIYAALGACRADATDDVLELTSTNLQSNPLHDSATRRALICLPSELESNAPAPVVYYLPGFGNNSDKFLKNKAMWLTFAEKVSREVMPMRLVIVDGYDHWGCSQFINSPAQGNYANYVCDEIVSRVEARYAAPKKGIRRIVAGHSSGGFGALRLGMYRPHLFDAVIALSPDSDFQVSHLPLVEIASVSNAPLSEVRDLMLGGGSKPLPKDGDFVYALALSAAYAPVGAGHPGEFEWLYDANHRLRPDIWQKWLDNDPYVMVKKNKNAFLPTQAVFVEGAAQDQFKANIGARKIYEVLKDRPARCAFREPPGKHSDHTLDRLQAGLEWVFEKHQRTGAK